MHVDSRSGVTTSYLPGTWSTIPEAGCAYCCTNWLLLLVTSRANPYSTDRHLGMQEVIVLVSKLCVNLDEQLHEYWALYSQLASGKEQPKEPTSDFSVKLNQHQNHTRHKSIAPSAHKCISKLSRGISASHLTLISPKRPREIIYSNTARFVRFAATSSTAGRVVAWVQITW